MSVTLAPLIPNLPLLALDAYFGCGRTAEGGDGLHYSQRTGLYYCCNLTHHHGNGIFSAPDGLHPHAQPASPPSLACYSPDYRGSHHLNDTMADAVYHKVKKSLPAHETSPASDVTQKILFMTLGPLEEEIRTAKKLNDWARVKVLEDLKATAKDEIESTTPLWPPDSRDELKRFKANSASSSQDSATANTSHTASSASADEGTEEGQKENQEEDEEGEEEFERVDFFSVFGHPPAMYVGELFNQQLYVSTSANWKGRSDLCSYCVKRHGVALEQLDPDAFPSLLEDFVERKSLANNKSDWRAKPVLAERLSWCKKYGSHTVSWEDRVVNMEKCFCPTPDPRLRWQWNFTKCAAVKEV